MHPKIREGATYEKNGCWSEHLSTCLLICEKIIQIGNVKFSEVEINLGKYVILKNKQIYTILGSTEGTRTNSTILLSPTSNQPKSFHSKLRTNNKSSQVKFIFLIFLRRVERAVLAKSIEKQGQEKERGHFRSTRSWFGLHRRKRRTGAHYF